MPLPIRTSSFVGGHRARIHPVGHTPRRQRPSGDRRGPRRSRPARLPHRRPARRGVPRIPRPGPCRRDEQRAALADGVHHGQPGAVRDAARPAPGSTWRSPSACSSHRERSRPRPSPGTGSSASSGWTARCAVFPALRRWWPCSTSWWSSCRSRRAPRHTSPPPVPVRVASTLNEVVTCLTTETPWPARPGPAGRRRSRTASRPGRCARPARRPASPRDRRSRRPPPAAGRGARLGQDDAGAALDRRPAGARSSRRAGGDDDPLGGRRGDAAGRTRDHSAVPGAAPHQLGGRAGRRRLGLAATGRDQPRSRWRPVPRRARRVSALGARRAARTTRGRRHPRGPSEQPRASCRPASSSSQPPTLARAAGARRARASATTSPGRGMSAGSPGRSLDRFDLRVAVQRPAVDELLDPGGGEPSAVVAARVADARRHRHRAGWTPQRRACTASCSTGGRRSRRTRRALLRSEIERERLTGRGYHRIRRVARTIADLHGARDGMPPPEALDVEHVSIALSLRTRLRAAAAGLVA